MIAARAGPQASTEGMISRRRASLALVVRAQRVSETNKAPLEVAATGRAEACAFGNGQRHVHHDSDTGHADGEARLEFRLALWDTSRTAAYREGSKSHAIGVASRPHSHGPLDAGKMENRRSSALRARLPSICGAGRTQRTSCLRESGTFGPL